MNRKLNRLTDEHIEDIMRLRDEWMDVGLSCEPCDIEEAKAAATDVYRVSGFDPPTWWVVADSPLGAGMCDLLVQYGLGDWRVGRPLHDRLIASRPLHPSHSAVWEYISTGVVSFTVYERIEELLADPIRDRIETVRTEIRAAMSEAVLSAFDLERMGPIWRAAGAAVRDVLAPSVWTLLNDEMSRPTAITADRLGAWNKLRSDNELRPMTNVDAMLFGSHEAEWLSMHMFIHQLTQDDRARAFLPVARLAHHCGWWLPRKELCILQHRPTQIEFDENGLLHNDNGPAIAYRDGWSIWSIHGVQVDQKTVMRPDLQRIDEILDEPNEERRRIRIDRFGWSRLLTESNATIIETRQNDIDNTKECLAAVSDNIRLLICHCPSQGKVFALSVPPGTQTCEQAQNFLHSGSALDDLLGPIRTIGRS